MPGSSELSDALNPNFFSEKRRTRYIVNSGADSGRHSDVSPTQEFDRRLDGNEGVTSSPEISPVLAVRPRQDPAEFLKTLLSSFAECKRTMDAEIERRRIWEEDQETRHLQHISELEEKLSEMQKEINDLRHIVEQPRHANSQDLRLTSLNVSNHETIKSNDSPLFTPTTSDASRKCTARSPNTPTSQSQFVQGRSIDCCHKRDRSPSQEKAVLKVRKRLDNRPRTIQAAVRCHTLQLMRLEDDKRLPPSHDKSTSLGDDDPIRFIWEKTTKKHVHNGKMKNRVISDLLANKALYPLVPDEDFTRARLDSTFEQVYTALRHRFSSQVSGDTTKEELRVKRSRRIGRKKNKLANRLAVRRDLPEYQHPCYNSAFQLDCMSSEESSEDEGFSDASDDETSHTEGQQRATFLRIRYHAWRSSRLRKLYQIIDARYEVDYSLKPKRGSGRMDRRIGLPKEGNLPPPLGTPKWMVSKKWQREVRASGSQLSTVLDTILKEDDEQTLRCISALGPESDSEEVLSNSPSPPPPPPPPPPHPPAPINQPTERPMHSSLPIPGSIPGFLPQHLLDHQQVWHPEFYLPGYMNVPGAPM